MNLVSWHCHIFETEKEMEGWGLMQWELPVCTAKGCPVSATKEKGAIILIALTFCLLQSLEVHVIALPASPQFPMGLEHRSRSELQTHLGLPSSPYAAHWGNAAAPIGCQLGTWVLYSVYRCLQKLHMYSSFTLLTLLLLSGLSSDCSWVKMCRISESVLLLSLSQLTCFFGKLTALYSGDTFSMFCFSNCLKTMIYTAMVEWQMQIRKPACRRLPSAFAVI